MDYGKWNALSLDLPCMIYLGFYQIVLNPSKHYTEVSEKSELISNIERKTSIWFIKLYAKETI